MQLKKSQRSRSGWTREQGNLAGNKRACCAIGLPKKAGNFVTIFNTWKSKAPITLKLRGAGVSVPRCGSCFPRNRGHCSRSASIFRPPAPVADWAAKVLEEAPAAVQAARALVLACLALALSIE